MEINPIKLKEPFPENDIEKAIGEYEKKFHSIIFKFTNAIVGQELPVQLKKSEPDKGHFAENGAGLPAFVEDEEIDGQTADGKREAHIPTYPSQSKRRLTENE